MAEQKYEEKQSFEITYIATKMQVMMAFFVRLGQNEVSNTSTLEWIFVKLSVTRKKEKLYINFSNSVQPPNFHTNLNYVCFCFEIVRKTIWSFHNVHNLYAILLISIINNVLRSCAPD